jgi:hypothetical protein
MSEIGEIKLNLSQPQWRKIHKDKTVLIKPESIGCGMKVHLPQDKIKKLQNAKKKNKGIKLSLSAEEKLLAGEGFKDVLKKGWKGYQKIVKPVVGPLIRKGLKAVVKAALPAAAVALGQPELAPAASALANSVGDQAVDKLGDVTGAYGLKKNLKLKDDWSNFVNHRHPAMNPRLPLPDFSTPNTTNSGGRLLVKAGHPKVAITRAGSFLPV